MAKNLDREWMIPVSGILAVELCLWVILHHRGYTYAPQITAFESISFSSMALVASFHVLRFLRLNRWPPNPLERLAAAALERRSHLLSVLIAVQFAAIGVSAFCALKAGIPKVVPFWADIPVYNFELATFGAPPWQISQHFLKPLTPTIELVYSTFVPVSTIAMFAVVTLKPSALKTRALIALYLTWLLLGLLAAYAFSSAGPIFYDRVYGGHRLSGLELTLQHAPVSVNTANILWLSYQANRPIMVANGISAIPSMHLAVTMWLALLLSRTRYASLGWGYLALIWIGSVHLGWHYVTDGAVGMAGAFIIWTIAPALAVRNAELAQFRLVRRTT